MGGGYKYVPNEATKPVTYRVISSDSHVIEPDSLFTPRVSKQYRDRCIHVESHPDGDWYYVDGNRILGLGLAGTEAGMRFDDEAAKKLDFGDGKTFADVPKGGYDPDERMKDMDLDGIDIDVLYPTVGLVFWRTILDSKLLSEHCRVYNDWVGEFCKAHPDRLKAIATLNVDDPEEAATELKRAHKLGFIGALIPTKPYTNRPYSRPEYDVLWATAVDLGMPISLHLATTRQSWSEGISTTIDPAVYKMYDTMGNIDFEIRPSISAMIMSGVFERHPGLMVGAIEYHAAWTVFHRYALDDIYQGQFRMLGKEVHFSNNMLPSDYYRRNVFLGWQEDRLAVELREYIGVENLQWGSDYPHIEGTWPESRRVLTEVLEGVPEAEQAMIAGKNVARLYHLD